MEDTRDSVVDSGPRGWSTRVWAPRALGAVLLVAIAAIGAVHPPIRAAVAALALLAGVECLRVGSRRWPPGAGALGLGVAAGAILLWSAIAFVPLGPSGRALLQPGLADLLDATLGAIGRTRHPLAVNPRAALGEWGLWCGVFVLSVGSAAIVRTRTALRETSRWLVAVAAGVALVGLLQRASGADSVYWVTGLGAANRTPFFGPFVSQNHAAAWLAAAMPVAIAGAFATTGPERRAFAVAIPLLGVATVATGSRSAWPLLAVGLVAAALFSGRAVAVRVAAGAALAGIVFGFVAGPSRVLVAIASRLGPEGDDPWSGRVALWRDAMRLVGDAPIAGIGLGGFGDAVLVAKTTPGWVTTAHAHQEPLEVAVEQGIPALVACAAVGLAAVVWGVPRLRKLGNGTRRTLLAGWLGALAAIGAASLWDFPLRAGGIAVTAAIGTGVAIGLLDATGPSASPRALRTFRGAVEALSAVAALAVVGWVALGRADVSVWGPAEDALRAGRAVVRTDPAAAERWFAVAVARRPFDVDGLLGLAEARWRGGEPAIDLVDLALRVQPTSERAWLSKARLHRARGEIAKAAAAYRRHLALDQQDIQALASLGEALSLGVPVADVLPARPDRRCHAARLLDREGDPITAEVLYEETAPLLPRCAELYAEDLVAWGEPAYALVVAEGAEPGCGQDRVAGLALEALGRHAEALERLDAAMRTCIKKDAKLRVALGRARVGLGDPAGIAILEHVVASEPDAPWIRRALIRSYDDMGRPDLARAQLEALRDAGAATPAELARLGP